MLLDSVKEQLSESEERCIAVKADDKNLDYKISVTVLKKIKEEF